MKIQVKTALLRSMLDKIAKGVDDAQVQAISGCVSIEVADEKLVLRTTNRTHLLKVTEPKAFPADTSFYVCVPFQLFWKLVSKMTVSELSLEVGEKTLNIKGNGDYTIPIMFDVDGTVCQVKDIEFAHKTDIKNESGEIVGQEAATPVSFEITLAQMQDVLNYNGASAIRQSNVSGGVMGYYLDANGFITYDNTACLNNMILPNVKSFLPKRLVDICPVFTAEKVKFDILPSVVRISSGNDELTYKLTDESYAENYPAPQIRALAENKFDGSCKVNRAETLNALDRLSLFIKTGPTQILSRLRMIFDEGKLTLFDPYGKNIEVIKATEMKNIGSFTQDVDLMQLKGLMSCHESELLELGYGSQIGVMITNKNIVQLIPSLEDETVPDTTTPEEPNASEDDAFAAIAMQSEDEE